MKTHSMRAFRMAEALRGPQAPSLTWVPSIFEFLMLKDNFFISDESTIKNYNYSESLSHYAYTLRKTWGIIGG